jgi:MATE family multidrug resistance protein
LPGSPGIGTSFGETTLAANAILMNFFMVAGYYLDGFATAAEQISGRAHRCPSSSRFDQGSEASRSSGALRLAGITTAFYLILGNADRRL